MVITAKFSVDRIIDDIARIFLTDKAADRIWLSADLRSLLMATDCCHTEAENCVDYFLSGIVEAAGADRTILVSAFNFDFPRTKLFDNVNTPVQTGAFGNFLLKKYPKNRMVHPFYSFLAFGNEASELTEKRFKNSTGKESILGWVVDEKTDLLAIGHHYVKSLSTVHHAEHLAGVSYRYPKLFFGEHHLFGKIEQTECQFYVREIDICDFSSLTLKGDDCFRSHQLLASSIVGFGRRPALAHRINLAKCHKLMIDDLNARQTNYVDYFGPERTNEKVITARVSDNLYLAELKEKTNDN